MKCDMSEDVKYLQEVSIVLCAFQMDLLCLRFLATYFK